MIKLHKSGQYRLIETKHRNKVLYLDETAYAWVEPKEIGELLVATHKEHSTDSVLSTGQYRFYRVENEPELTDQYHLELETGKGFWQGYLVLSGLPDDTKKRRRIIPTDELISGRHRFWPSQDLTKYTVTSANIR